MVPGKHQCPKKGQVLCAPKHAEVTITVALIQECYSGQEGTEPWGCPDPPDRWLGIRELALCCCRYLGYLCTHHQGPREEPRAIPRLTGWGNCLPANQKPSPGINEEQNPGNNLT